MDEIGEQVLALIDRVEGAGLLFPSQADTIFDDIEAKIERHRREMEFLGSPMDREMAGAEFDMLLAESDSK